ncbi:hypothetical protein CTAYLR_010002 [Chrysophaeum taylorii]|uniref:fructose-bisphosphatase n=1 Tax=Chrysophaeum taylorii TaxID=2483200 RepID=A0AAD7UJ83_9STRA|nr:hypothetical protein CTAYLR_010002 [Chrysophaeum taylorii]
MRWVVAGVVLCAAGLAPETRRASVARGHAPTTLSRFMLERTRDDPESRDLEALIASVQMACKTISALVLRAGLEELTGLQGETNVQGEEQKKLDVIANQVLKDALRYTGRLGVVASEEEALPLLVDEALDSRYVAVFDPLDGSSNIDASIATGTIFGIFRQTEECRLNYRSDEKDVLDANATKCLLNTLQPGDSLVAAGYCMYSSSTILVLTFGDGVHGFTLDSAVNEFVLTHPRMRIPDRGKIYSCNEANEPLWDAPVRDYVRDLKLGRGQTATRYSSRYVGSMVADVHRTLLHGGLWFYPADTTHPSGKIRLLYEAAPMSFIVEQAGGRSSTGTRSILSIHPTTVHQRVAVFLGSKDDVAELESYFLPTIVAPPPTTSFAR